MLIYGSDFYINVAGTIENCVNGTDDDQDGLIDFEDTDCQYPVKGSLVNVSGEYIEWYSSAEILYSETSFVTGPQFC